MSNTQSLFTRSNQGTLFTSHTMQNSPLPKSSLLSKPHLSRPRDLLSVPSIAPLLTVLCLYGRGSPLLGSLYFYTSNSPSEVQSKAFE